MCKDDVILLSQLCDIIGKRQRVFADIIKVPNHLTLNEREITLGMPDLINNLFKAGSKPYLKLETQIRKDFLSCWP